MGLRGRQTGSGCRLINVIAVTNLVRFILRQTAAEVGVAPGERLAPGGGNQHFVLLHSKYALVGAHDLSHGLLQLWIQRYTERSERCT